MKVTLPTGHPYTTASGDQVDPWTLAAAAIAFRRAQFGGWKMMAEDPDDDEDSEDEEEGTAHPDDTVKVGDRTFKVSELQTIMAREKRQGKKSGRTSLLKELGFESLEAAKEALAAAGSNAGTDGSDQGGAAGGAGSEQETQAAKAAAAREAAAAQREKEAARKARRADLRGALRDFGVARDDLDDAYALLDRAIDAEYDEDDLEEAVEDLKSRRPILFADNGQAGDDDQSPPPPPRASLPKGAGGRRQGSKAQTFGAGGLERARRKGWVKDAS